MTFSRLPVDRAEIELARRQSEENLDVLRSGYRIPNLLRDVNRTQFHTAYHHHNGRDLQKRFADIHLALDPTLEWCAAAASQPRTRRRPRIGYFAGLGGSHIVARSIRALMEASDQSSAEQLLILPVDGRDGGGTVPTVLIDGNLASARSAIADLDLDILVYSEIGMDPFSYYLSFSRLARIQAVMPGQGITSGVPAIDFYLTSSHWEPKGEIDHHYTEHPLRLPTPPYFFLPDVKNPNPGIRADLNIGEDTHLYLCNHTLYKYHPDFDELLADILKMDPKALVVLLYAPDDPWWSLLLKRWSARVGEMMQRVRALPRMTRTNYLGIVQAADVILDAPHHSSGITAYEALFLGTPLITSRSPFMRGGMTAGLYEMLGAPELVAANATAYTELAVQVASDRDTRSGIAQRLKAERSKLVCKPESANLFLKSLTEMTHSRL